MDAQAGVDTRTDAIFALRSKLDDGAASDLLQRQMDMTEQHMEN
jgi:hypothetical protein